LFGGERWKGVLKKGVKKREDQRLLDLQRGSGSGSASKHASGLLGEQGGETCTK
jgi:hypothetical protein